MGENLLSLRVQTGDRVTVHHKLVHAAQKIAVKRHAVRVCRVFFRRLRAVRLRHAHSQQHIRGSLRVLRACQRRGGIDPDIPILGF